MQYEGMVYRPPSEAYSLIIQVTIGCSHNKCRFCSMYKDKQFHIRQLEDILADLRECRAYYSRVKRIFLADGDALCLSNAKLLAILEAIRELLLIDTGLIDVEEIILIPSQTRNEPVTLYLVDRDHQSFLRAESTVNVSSRAAQNFNSAFMECLEAAAPEYIDAHIRFPAMFLDGCYVRELESRSMYHIPQISISHVTEGTLDVEASTAYVMHFFDHPDVARQVEEGEDFVWYADEKHTVRYDVHGLLQYVSTQDPSERETLSLQEAYRLAYSFLQADLAFDKTLLQEIYLCDLEISEGGTYTFSWNYAYNHVPFSMSPETRQWTDLASPIQIVVEGAQVRYYHRYLLDKTMEADAIFSIRETYIEALAGMLAGLPEETRIRAFGLEYGETEDKLVLFWKADTDQGQLSMPVEEVRT